ncbi:unnamed protein product [Prunus armeniaca]
MHWAASSVIHPPYFDGTNYDVWKVKMRAFLWALDDRVWYTIENGWIEPTKTVKDEPFHLNSLSSYARVRTLRKSGVKILESVLVKKVLRSLSERFKTKVVAIEDVKNLDTLKLQKLIRSLKTYEMKLFRAKEEQEQCS